MAVRFCHLHPGRATLRSANLGTHPRGLLFPNTDGRHCTRAPSARVYRPAQRARPAGRANLRLRDSARPVPPWLPSEGRYVAATRARLQLNLAATWAKEQLRSFLDAIPGANGSHTIVIRSA